MNMIMATQMNYFDNGEGNDLDDLGGGAAAIHLVEVR